MARRARSLAVIAAALFAAACQLSLWAGPLDDPYRVDVPGRVEATPTAAPTP